ncbi:MAG: hypothetical protein ABIO94_13785 [Opitutaceae bacterium]
MKAATLLLTGSLVVNAALFTALIAGFSAETTTSTVIRTRLPTDASTASVSPSAIDPKTWTNLQPADLAGLFDRLRAAGLSPAVARALLKEQVRAQFTPRRASLNRAMTEGPFWESVRSNPATVAALGQLTREQNQTLKDLLGPDALLDESATAILRRQLPNFSEAKITAIQRARQELDEIGEQLLEGAAPPEFEALMNEREADIARMLTPQEREDYDLRTGDIANSLRRRLAGFDPTEKEFRDLYRSHRAYEESAKRPAGAVDVARPSTDAEKQLVEQMKATLGEPRYADYQRSLDGNYQQTARLVARLELPAGTANQVYAVQKEIEQRVTTLEANRALPTEDRSAQLGALAHEAEAKVTSFLGPRGFEAYKQYGGFWLTNLQPRAAPAPRPPGP